MTVSASTSRQVYSGNGATKTFPVTIPFLAADDLLVIEQVTASGEETIKALNSDYTVDVDAEESLSAPRRRTRRRSSLSAIRSRSRTSIRSTTTSYRPKCSRRILTGKR